MYKWRKVPVNCGENEKTRLSKEEEEEEQVELKLFHFLRRLEPTQRWEQGNRNHNMQTPLTDEDHASQSKAAQSFVYASPVHPEEIIQVQRFDYWSIEIKLCKTQRWSLLTSAASDCWKHTSAELQPVRLTAFRDTIMGSSPYFIEPRQLNIQPVNALNRFSARRQHI